MKIDVRSNIAEVKRALDAQHAEIRDNVASRAINRVATTVRNEASKEIRKVYNIKTGTAKSAISIKPARPRNPQATVTASGARLPLLAFAARQVKAGVSLKVLVAGQRKTIRHAFIRTSKRGIQGVFERTGKARYPIKFLTGIGIAQAFGTKVVMGALQKVVADRFPVVYQQELKFSLSKGGPLRAK